MRIDTLLAEFVILDTLAAMLYRDGDVKLSTELQDRADELENEAYRIQR